MEGEKFHEGGAGFSKTKTMKKYEKVFQLKLTSCIKT